jgi:aryl-alcohol dehydrogenase-like predicted oxidoreductase
LDWLFGIMVQRSVEKITMELRMLGRSGLKVAPLCFGGNVFGWTADERRSFELLDTFIAAGFNCIDTADVYSRWVPGHHGGESEAIIGNWMKSRRNRSQVLIATKVGMEMQGKKGLSRAHILASIDGSLQRLQTDYVDLYQSHVADPETPIEETLSTFAELIAAGKVRAIGASNYTRPQLSAALTASEQLGLPRYESLQPEYNLYTVEPYQSELEPLCRDSELGVIPYYALAGGFLTGKYRSEQDFARSARGPSMKRYLNARGLRILAALDEVAAETQATLAQTALAWLIAQPTITAPIASATSRAQLDEMLGAVRLKLDASAIERLNRASR